MYLLALRKEFSLLRFKNTVAVRIETVRRTTTTKPDRDRTIRVSERSDIKLTCTHSHAHEAVALL